MQQHYFYTLTDPPQPPPFNWQPYLTAGFVVLFIVSVWALLWKLVFAPRWRVWSAHQEGLADLAQARTRKPP